MVLAGDIASPVHCAVLFICVYVILIVEIFLLPLQELAAVDHSKVYYQPFRKNFYVEVPELARLTPEGNLFFFSFFIRHLADSGNAIKLVHETLIV